MSVNEEFLDEVLEPLLIDSMTGGSKDYQTQELFDETKKAMLQHFQQEQEKLEERIINENEMWTRACWAVGEAGEKVRGEYRKLVDKGGKDE